MDGASGTLLWMEWPLRRGIRTSYVAAARVRSRAELLALFLDRCGARAAEAVRLFPLFATKAAVADSLDDALVFIVYPADDARGLVRLEGRWASAVELERA